AVAREYSGGWPKCLGPLNLASTLCPRAGQKEHATPSALVLWSNSSVQPTATPGQQVWENSSRAPSFFVQPFTTDDFEIGHPLGKSNSHDHGRVGSVWVAGLICDSSFLLMQTLGASK
uniref:Uncharacterized protein n=1 Tax=Oryctolagus cuniculus TaxID=9986 RepID=A0A5F9CIH0_RABIT